VNERRKKKNRVMVRRKKIGNAKSPVVFSKGSDMTTVLDQQWDHSTDSEDQEAREQTIVTESAFDLHCMAGMRSWCIYILIRLDS